MQKNNINTTNSNLIYRNTIIKSQTKFISFLNIEIINKLIHLFDTKNTNVNYKITDYIEDERKQRGLDSTGITILSEVYGTNKQKPTLFLIIKKDDIDLLHLSIHLVARNLNPKSSGIIHIMKNIYNNNSITGPDRSKLYALISVKQPLNKMKSLEFNIANGYNSFNF